jgi:hypothetical protein
MSGSVRGRLALCRPRSEAGPASVSIYMSSCSLQGGSGLDSTLRCVRGQLLLAYLLYQGGLGLKDDAPAGFDFDKEAAAVGSLSSCLPSKRSALQNLVISGASKATAPELQCLPCPATERGGHRQFVMIAHG